MNFQVDDNGYYGAFGGAFIPEMLHPNIEELKDQYIGILDDPDFQDDFHGWTWRSLLGLV